MEEDLRYKIIRTLLKEGHINSFADIFMYIPKTTVAHDLGLNVTRFSSLIENVENLRVRDVYRLAGLCKISPLQLFELIEKQYLMSKNRKKK
jgi:hypothetical protein